MMIFPIKTHFQLLFPHKKTNVSSAISEVNSSGHNIDPLSSNPKIPLKENAASFHVQKNYLSNSIIGDLNIEITTIKKI